MTASAAYDDILGRLSRQSVLKHFDAYEDVPWDDPACRIEADDPRWELSDDHVLGSTDWYKSQPQSFRARLGLYGIVSQMKLGVEFESILSRGLLEFAETLPNGAPEFRYVYHELIEEGQHSLMFQEFVNRSGLDPRGMSSLEATFARRVPRLARKFPELFFLFVLGGEGPIDHVQRQELRKRDALHPLLRRVMQIHVTEEARHLCFAQNYLRMRIPELGTWRRLRLQVQAPIILATMAQQMLAPPKHLIRTFRVPRSVVREAYTEDPRHRERMIESLGLVRKLCAETGLLVPAWWKVLGLLPADAEQDPPASGRRPRASSRERSVRPASAPPVSAAACSVVSMPVPGVVRGWSSMRPLAMTA